MYITICLWDAPYFFAVALWCAGIEEKKNIQQIILGAGLVTDLLHPKCRGEPYRMPFLLLGFVTHSPSNGEVTFNYCTLMQFFQPLRHTGSLTVPRKIPSHIKGTHNSVSL